jgi:hypothetical protein
VSSSSDDTSPSSSGRAPDTPENGTECRMLASSQALGLASPVFKKMLDGRFREGPKSQASWISRNSTLDHGVTVVGFSYHFAATLRSVLRNNNRGRYPDSAI